MSISKLFVTKRNSQHIRQLYPGAESDRRIRILGKEKACIFCGIMIAVIMIAVPVFVADHNRLTSPVDTLYRNEYGGGSKTVSLRAHTGDGYEERIKIDVEEREYTKAELDEFSRELDDVLFTAILGKNDDPGNVMYDLDLKTHLEGYPFEIAWKSDRPLILSGKGVINTERLSEEDPEDEGVNTLLCATLSYEKHTEDKYAYIVLHRKKASSGEKLSESIRDSVKERDDRSKTESIQELPKSVAGTALYFYEDSVNRGWAVLFFGTVTAFLLMAVCDRKLKEMSDKRREQMDRDHPGILNQYILYYMAGMNPRSIWISMCKRYEESLDRAGKNRRYAYEEMLTAKKRMEEGCSELAAYDEFSARCDNARYRSFISFVKQAVVKGNEGLYDILYEEMEKAQREKNNRIKKEASEAETKLLLPMFMMLAVVLAIVMIPAFIGLNS